MRWTLVTLFHFIIRLVWLKSNLSKYGDILILSNMQIYKRDTILFASESPI